MSEPSAPIEKPPPQLAIVAIERVKLDAIVMTPERRAKAEASEIDLLAESIQRLGRLMSPIRVRRDLRLICGARRVVALEQLGYTEVDAVICDGDDIEVELDEIEENLARRDLTVLERAAAEKRRKELYLQRHPETRRGVAGARAKYVQAKTPSFATSVAKPGSGERLVQQRIQIAEKLAPVIPLLAKSNIADNHSQLLKLAQVSSPVVRQKAATLLAEGKAHTAISAVSMAEQGQVTRPSKPKARRGRSDDGRLVTAQLRKIDIGYETRVVLRGREFGILISPDCSRIQLLDQGAVRLPPRPTAPQPSEPLTTEASRSILREVLEELPEDAAAHVRRVEDGVDDRCACPSCGSTAWWRGRGTALTCTTCQPPVPDDGPATTVRVDTPRTFQKAVIENHDGYGGKLRELRIEWWLGEAYGHSRKEPVVVIGEAGWPVTVLTLAPASRETTASMRSAVRRRLLVIFQGVLKLGEENGRYFRPDGTEFILMPKPVPPVPSDDDNDRGLDGGEA